jgi:hypothetical protein
MNPLEEYGALLKIRRDGVRRQMWIFGVLAFLLWAAFLWDSYLNAMTIGEIVGQVWQVAAVLVVLGGAVSKGIEVKIMASTLELLEALQRRRNVGGGVEVA